MVIGEDKLALALVNRLFYGEVLRRLLAESLLWAALARDEHDDWRELNEKTELT